MCSFKATTRAFYIQVYYKLMLRIKARMRLHLSLASSETRYSESGNCYAPTCFLVSIVTKPR